MDKEYQKWLKRAKSSLILSKTKKIDELCFEDLCYEAQQSAEKSLKALIIYFGLKPPKTHSFHILLLEIEKRMEVPENLMKVFDLNNYAVQTRYPGDYDPIDEKEYQNAVNIAEFVYNWVKENIS